MKDLCVTFTWNRVVKILAFKIHKNEEKKMAFIFFQKVIYYIILFCKNCKFNTIYQRIYELLPDYNWLVFTVAIFIYF